MSTPPRSADADGRGAGQPVTGFGTKKAAFLSRYRAHPEYGNRSAAGRVAAELAPLAGLQAGTGRTYIAEELRKLTGMARPRLGRGGTMTSPQAEPPAQALGESLAALAVQVAALRGQVAHDQPTARSGRAPRRPGPGRPVRGTRPDSRRRTGRGRAPRSRRPVLDRPGPASLWAQLAELRQWADTVLRQHYGGYELRDCWPSHIHAVWELSTLAAAWHHAYGGNRPDLARALEFYDRWLPGTMRRIAHITRTCVPECAMRRRRPW